MLCSMYHHDKQRITSKGRRRDFDGLLKFFRIAIDSDNFCVYIVYIVYIQLTEVIMNIIISNASDKPIYEQITTQIKALIMNGQLSEGDALPSMRLLARELRISVITTKRAYEELERDGFIETVPGKGCFVAGENRELLREEQLRITEQYLSKAIESARACSLSLAQLQEMLALLYE